MASGDASFTAPFKLVAERSDNIHAIVAYFDASFSMCHKKMGSHFFLKFFLIIRLPKTRDKYVDASFFVDVFDSRYNHKMQCRTGNSGYTLETNSAVPGR
ncbi:putative protein arginine N-methyltransferase 1.2 [Cardamine amara subsp. amara]|uniref:Uncharacterized protein n=1 Tax=Cardamine amara subsp. amara TaxID=228776 RepID=A0ABD1BMD0_CARAN